MIIKELTCIGCPLGCSLKVEINEERSMIVRGNNCPIGERYAKSELTNPKRVVTSTVRVKDGVQCCVSVKTKTEIPKDKVMQCMKSMQHIVAQAPVHIGDVILENIADTGVDLVATKNVEKIYTEDEIS